jgi:hypothetical protein
VTTPIAPKHRALTVDRVEGKVAVLVDDNGRAANVELSRLPPGAREGSVLRAPDRYGKPDFSAMTLDDEEMKRRVGVVGAAQKKMGAGDPGGDIRL